MQQGHPRYKQLSRARHEMCMHKQRIVSKNILDGMVDGIIAVGRAYGRALRRTLGIDQHEDLEAITHIFPPMTKGDNK